MERVIQRLAEEQVRVGHEVHVVTSVHGAGGRPREEELNGVCVHRVRGWRLHYPDLTMPLEVPEKLLKHTHVVHVHSQSSLFNIVLAKHAKRLGKPLVVDFLALDYLKSHTNPLIRYLGGYYQEKIQYEAAKLVDKAVTLNERDWRILMEKYGVESTVIPHGIDEKYLTKPKDERLFREKYGVYEENVVAYVGRIHPSKGLDVLIKAVPLIVREVNDFAVVIAGGGSEVYRRSLLMTARKLKVEDKVRILGYISEDGKISLLDASRVFVFPTRHFGEAYPLVVDEAYAREVPIVATEVGALPFRVEHMRTGILVTPDNPSSLAKAVATLLENDDLFIGIRSRLRNVKGSLLTWKQVCIKLNSIYES
ncbi:MAG: glycosyltransferase family 4 protein [Thermoproteales archaeon]|nr:glycosyltransferase family 4 protein [Thermoproteales archaeon]